MPFANELAQEFVPIAGELVKAKVSTATSKSSPVSARPVFRRTTLPPPLGQHDVGRLVSAEHNSRRRDPGGRCKGRANSNTAKMGLEATHANEFSGNPELSGWSRCQDIRNLVW